MVARANRIALGPRRLTVRTALFQGANTGSIPVGVILRNVFNGVKVMVNT